MNFIVDSVIMMAGYADVVVLRHPESTAIAVNVYPIFYFANRENILHCV